MATSQLPARISSLGLSILGVRRQVFGRGAGISGVPRQLGVVSVGRRGSGVGSRPHHGAGASCGTTPTFTTHMAESSMVVGMILTNGADCGYVFASGAKVTASIAFTCDR